MINPSKPRTTKVRVSSKLLARAAQLGVNISEAAEQGIADAVAKSVAAKWLQENQDALLSSNAFVEEHGVPLARFRQF
ncbi:post-segregation antitoxin CcdA [Paucibacter aquatile]|uniref:Post-segregation antitoxin CcdA n=1 Tax=Kinneretia aquatilis TaxID=2070761 RepID=A0A2N8KVB7_9BURK|nr:type II toxin-antitoxin system CcdA family antitoxin [Paucibacter aquatile]PND37381.1 post-segregation antitoxin CcdA [Paucibacter aquatile]